MIVFLLSGTKTKEEFMLAGGLLGRFSLGAEGTLISLRRFRHEAPAPLPGPASAPPAGPRGGGPIEGENGNWRCPSCSNVNFFQRTACNRCQSAKPAPETPRGFGPGFRTAPAEAEAALRDFLAAVDPRTATHEEFVPWLKGSTSNLSLIFQPNEQTL